MMIFSSGKKRRLREVNTLDPTRRETKPRKGMAKEKSERESPVKKPTKSDNARAIKGRPEGLA